VYGITLSDPSSIRDFTKAISIDSEKFSYYLFSKMGYSDYYITLAQQAFKLIEPFVDIFD